MKLNCIKWEAPTTLQCIMIFEIFCLVYLQRFADYLRGWIVIICGGHVQFKVSGMWYLHFLTTF